LNFLGAAVLGTSDLRAGELDMTRPGLLAVYCGTLLALLVSGFAQAQDLQSWFSSPEENAQRTLGEGKQGVLFIETILSEQGQPRNCYQIEIGLARLGDGWKSHMPTRIQSPLLQPFNPILGGVAGIFPGDCGIFPLPAGAFYYCFCVVLPALKTNHRRLQVVMRMLSKHSRITM
jgi:hypothetical protein